MDSLIGLDFETYSATDLPTHGLFRYIEDPTFRPLIASSVRSTDGTVAHSPRRYTFVADHGDVAIEKLEKEIAQSTYIVAHNAIFEQQVLRKMGLVYPDRKSVV